jgi:hypothetical protein
VAGTTAKINAITTDNAGALVAAGWATISGYASIFVSTNGAVSWIRYGGVLPAVGFVQQGLAWNGSVFCLIHDGDAYVSATGLSWSAPVAIGAGFSATCYIAALGSIFCAVAYAGGTGPVSVSADGVAWSTPADTGVNNMRAIAASNSGFVVVSQGTGNSGFSPNGTDWSLVADVNRDWEGVCFHSAIPGFVAVGPFGSTIRTETTLETP